MSWYDYIPGIGTSIELAKGNYGHAVADVTPATSLLYTGYEKYKGALDEKKQGLQDAATQSRALGQQLYGESMQGLSQAQQQFAPARAAALYGYGDPAAMTGGPSMYPVAPARPR